MGRAAEVKVCVMEGCKQHLKPEAVLRVLGNKVQMEGLVQALVKCVCEYVNRPELNTTPPTEHEVNQAVAQIVVSHHVEPDLSKPGSHQLPQDDDRHPMLRSPVRQEAAPTIYHGPTGL